MREKKRNHINIYKTKRQCKKGLRYQHGKSRRCNSQKARHDNDQKKIYKKTTQTTWRYSLSTFICHKQNKRIGHKFVQQFQD